MNFRDFAYWIQGFYELSGQCNLSNERRTIVRNHINLVKTTSMDKSDEARIEAVELLIDMKLEVADKALEAYIGTYFEHVIDKQHPDQAAADQAHAPHLVVPFTLDKLVRC